MSEQAQLTGDQILVEYLPRLIRLAERNMSQQLRRKLDAEDVGGSVARTVLRRMGSGQLQLENSEEVWKQLMVITLNKVRKKARYWQAQKRDFRRELHIADEGLQLADVLPDTADGGMPTALDTEIFSELMQQLSAMLDEKCRMVLELRLQDCSDQEIAQALGVSTRSITRYLKKIELAVQELSLQD